MHWTMAYLQRTEIPQGKTKLTLPDPETPNLYFEVRQKSRSFVYRRTKAGKAISRTIGKFPETSINEARQAVRVLRKKDFAALPTQRSSTSGSPKLSAFVQDHFIDYTTLRHKDFAPNLANYRNHIHPSLGQLRLSEINKLSVYRWMNQLVSSGLKNSTINKITVLLGQILGLAETLEIEGAPERRTLGLKQLPARPAHTVFLKPEEAKRLMEAVNQSNNPHLPDIVALLLLTGARKNEALKMRWEEVDIDNRQWVVPMSKNGKPRYIQLGEKACELLARRHAQRNESPYVFPSPITGEPYSSIFGCWKLARERAGLPHLRIHDLRHSFASALVNTGIPLYDVQHLLGHSSIKTTQRYAHLSPDRLQSSVQNIDSVY